jgi:hypothetical protein
MAPGNSILNAPDMTRLGQWLVDSALTRFSRIGHGGVVYTYAPGSYSSRSCEYDFDLGLLGLTRSRWTRLVNMYIDPLQLARFKGRVDRLAEADRQTLTVSLPFRELTELNHRERSHPWGGCLLALTYRCHPPTLILHSRTTRIGYTSFLDLALAYVIFKKVVSPATGLLPCQCKFIWYVDLPQLSCIFVIRYLMRSPIWKEILRHPPQGQPWTAIIKAYKRISKGKSKWGPSIKVYKDMQKKSTASIPVDSLELPTCIK